MLRGPLRFTPYNKRVFSVNNGFVPQYNLLLLFLQQSNAGNESEEEEGPSTSTAHVDVALICNINFFPIANREKTVQGVFSNKNQRDTA